MFSFVFGSFVLFHVQYINKQKLKGKNSVVQRSLPFLLGLVFEGTFQSASPFSSPRNLNVGTNLVSPPRAGFTIPLHPPSPTPKSLTVPC